MANLAYDQALDQYREAVRSLYRPLSGKLAERGAEIQEEALTARTETLVQASQQMEHVLSEAVLSGEPGLRDLASLKLLASAAVDLATAKDMLELGDTTPEAADRSASIILIDADIRSVLEAPLDGTGMGMLAADSDRSALPTEPEQARKALAAQVKTFIDEVSGQAGELATSAMTGAGAFGLGPAQVLASGAIDEISRCLPDIASRTIRAAARLIAEALKKLWAAFGKDAQDSIESEAQGWLKKIWNNGKLVDGLLKELYESEALSEEVLESVRTAQATSNFNGVNRRCEELEARYRKIKSILDWVLRAVGWTKPYMLSAVPWGPVAGYGIYASVLGYALYSGGDYLDARRFRSAWLDHVVGLHGLVASGLTQAHAA